MILSSSAGNLADALFLSVRSALYDLKIPRTRNVAYEAKEDKDAQGDSDMAGIKGAALGKKKEQKGEAGKRQAAGAEFEIEDYWDEGHPLEDAVREDLPVCITMNIVSLPTIRPS